MADWPLCYRIVTVRADSEVFRYQERHGAIVQRREVMQWLDGSGSVTELFATSPAHFFTFRNLAEGSHMKPSLFQSISRPYNLLSWTRALRLTFGLVSQLDPHRCVITGLFPSADMMVYLSINQALCKRWA